MQTIDRFDYVMGAYLFWSEHHSGQFSDGYARLCRYKLDLGACFQGWESLSEMSRDVYRAWCKKERIDCDYDSIRYRLSALGAFDLEDPCVEYFLEKHGDNSIEDSSLINYGHSDFVNIDMCYTHDLLRFYESNSESILNWLDQYCEAIGATSRLQAVEGQTIEDPDDLAAAFVNTAMTYLGGEILRALEDQTDY